MRQRSLISLLFGAGAVALGAPAQAASQSDPAVWPMTSRIQLAQTKTSQGSQAVQTQSPQAPISMPQPVGRFPTNTITDRPYVSPEGGQEGYKKTVGALQRTLTELQQLQL